MSPTAITSSSRKQIASKETDNHRKSSVLPLCIRAILYDSDLVVPEEVDLQVGRLTLRLQEKNRRWRTIRMLQRNN
jgi:hypothetical protein